MSGLSYSLYIICVLSLLMKGASLDNPEFSSMTHWVLNTNGKIEGKKLLQKVSSCEQQMTDELILSGVNACDEDGTNEFILDIKTQETILHLPSGRNELEIMVMKSGLSPLNSKSYSTHHAENFFPLSSLNEVSFYTGAYFEDLVTDIDIYVAVQNRKKFLYDIPSLEVQELYIKQGDIPSDVRQRAAMRILELDSSDIRLASILWVNIANTWRAERKLYFAVQCIRKAFSLDSKNTVLSAYIAIADILTMTNYLDDAIAISRDGIKKQPNNAMIHFVSGTILQKRQEFSEAIEELQISVNLNPRFFPARDMLQRSVQSLRDIKTKAKTNMYSSFSNQNNMQLERMSSTNGILSETNSSSSCSSSKSGLKDKRDGLIWWGAFIFSSHPIIETNLVYFNNFHGYILSFSLIVVGIFLQCWVHKQEANDNIVAIDTRCPCDSSSRVTAKKKY